jgi:hypothetical protein
MTLSPARCPDRQSVYPDDFASVGIINEEIRFSCSISVENADLAHAASGRSANRNLTNGGLGG